MEFTTGQHDVLQSAIRMWGENAQEAMLVGEVGELLTMFGRRSQGRDTPEDWVSEIADVIIMLEQLAKMRGYAEVKVEVDRKMSRLEDKIMDRKMDKWSW